MREIDAVIAEVKTNLAAKQIEIKKQGNRVISYVQEAFKNRQMEVSAFEKQVNNETDKANEPLIRQIKNDAQELIIGINKIKV